MRVSTSGSVSGQHAVAEVEDVARVAAVAASTSTHLGLDHGPRGQADGRVEVALDALVGADALPAGVERHPPVDADHVGAGVGHQAEQLAGADAEVDAGHAEVGQAGEHLPAGGQHVSARMSGG